MSKTADHPRSGILGDEGDVPKPDEIREQLRAILTSPAFHGSKRCQQFLEYVCDKSLAGHAGTLKERTLAVEIFGRQPQSDLGEDTIVRVGAREVRKRLAQYYVTPGGAASPILIDLPPGSYAPEFRYSPSLRVPIAPPAPAAPTQAPEPAIPAPSPLHRRSSRILGLVLAVSTIIIAFTAFLIARRTAETPEVQAFKLFWAPVLDDPEPLLVAVGNPLVYHVSARAHRLSEALLPPDSVPEQRPIRVPPKDLDGSDIIPVENQYVGFGDMVASTEVASMLVRESSATPKGVRLRFASSVQFADLRERTSLLIGAVTNHWTMEFEQNWRFQFRQAGPAARLTIVDTQAPPSDPARVWEIPSKEDGSSPEDYVLICRLHNTPAGGLVIVAAGIKQFGTEAAGRLLADPNQFGRILRQLPPGWDSKNVQVVLHTKVIGNAPAQPEVVASHVW